MFDFSADDDQLYPPRPRLGQHPMLDIAGPGPQRTPAELPGLDVPPVSSQPSSAGTESPKAAQIASRGISGAGPDIASGANSGKSALSANSDNSIKPSIAGPDHPITRSPDHQITMSGPTLDQDVQMHRNKLDYFRSTGSGISQIHNPILRGLARTADIAGSAFFPSIAANIPGTELHHRQLMGQETGAINQDLGQQHAQAQTGQEQAQTAHLGEEDKKIEHDLNADPASTPEEQAFAAELKKNGGDPMAAFKAVKQAGQKPAEPKEGEMPLGERVGQLNEMMTRRWQLNHPGEALPKEFTLPAHATQKDYDRIDKELEAVERAYTSKADRDRAFAEQKSQHEFMRMLALQNQADRERAAAEKKNKPSPDEQKRADLAKNMNENLDALEEIVRRRPDLFGPFAGRITGMKMATGSDDADIGALSTIEHQLGMVQQSTHGMRSAQGVEAAAHSIVNSYHNQPRAVLGAIAAARHSIQTFLDDANKAGNAGGGGGKVLSQAQVQQAAKEHHVSYEQAKKDAESHGFKVKE